MYLEHGKPVREHRHRPRRDRLRHRVRARTAQLGAATASSRSASSATCSATRTTSSCRRSSRTPRATATCRRSSAPAIPGRSTDRLPDLPASFAAGLARRARGCRISRASASMRSGSPRSTRARTSTGATTSPTTATSIPTSGRSPTTTRCRRRARARHRRLARPRSEPHLRPARRGSATTRVLRLVGRRSRTTGRSIFTGESRVELRRTAAAVLPAPVRAASSPTSTGGTRTCATSSTTSFASGSTAACAGCRIDVAHALIKDQRAARRRASTCATGPRCTRSTRAGRRSPREYDPKPTLMGETFVAARRAAAVLAAPRPRAELSRSSTPTSRSTRCARSSSRRWRELPKNREPVWFGSNHDHSRMATRWAGGDPAKAPGRALPPAHAAGRRDPLPGRRARARGRRRPAGPHPRRRRPAARPGAHADPVDAQRRRSGKTRGCRSRHDAQRRRPGGRPGSLLNYTRDLIARAQGARRRLRDAPELRGRLGLPRAATTTCALNMTAKPQTLRRHDARAVGGRDPLARRVAVLAHQRRRSGSHSSATCASP